MSEICIIGSGSFDLFLCVDHFPKEGETLNTTDSFIKNGGKGANQAVAASKLGAKTSFAGQFGNDKHGENLKLEMTQSGVNLEYLRLIDDVQTGQAIIMINEKGQNSIIIVGGANIFYKDLNVLPQNYVECIKNCKILQLQKEIPIEINVLAAVYAKKEKKLVMLDVGGRDEETPQQLLENLDFISPNETELSRVMKIQENLINTQTIREQLLSQYPQLKVVLKLGENGSSLITLENEIICKAVTQQNSQILNDYKIVDTTGAGDCFTSAFCVKFNEIFSDFQEYSQNKYLQCLNFANSAAFLAITVKGAMPSMPQRKDVDEFILKYSDQK